MMKLRVALLAVVCMLGASSLGHAAGPEVSKLVLPGDITLEQAQVVLQAAVAKAEEQGTLMNIAVVDAGGNLKGFVRMDGVFLASVDGKNCPFVEYVYHGLKWAGKA